MPREALKLLNICLFLSLGAVLTSLIYKAATTPPGARMFGSDTFAVLTPVFVARPAGHPVWARLHHPRRRWGLYLPGVTLWAALTKSPRQAPPVRAAMELSSPRRVDEANQRLTLRPYHANLLPVSPATIAPTPRRACPAKRRHRAAASRHLAWEIAARASPGVHIRSASAPLLAHRRR